MVVLVKIDQYNQPEARMDWISIDKALTELAVRKQTLYAYVSRGLVRAKADESDPRRSLYSASDVGKNASDCVFLGDRLMPIVATLRMARRTQAIVRQNFLLAIGYNVIAVPLAFLGFVTPLVAALAMSGSSLLVVGNAMRLKIPITKR